jgi:hypothetical protein
MRRAFDHYTSRDCIPLADIMISSFFSSSIHCQGHSVSLAEQGSRVDQILNIHWDTAVACVSVMQQKSRMTRGDTQSVLKIDVVM